MTKTPLLRDDNHFRYLSPDPGPGELGIPDGYNAPLEIGTTAEMVADRQKAREMRRADMLDILHRYRRGEIKTADEAADALSRL